MLRKLSCQIRWGRQGLQNPKAWQPGRMPWPDALGVLRRDYMEEWELIWPCDSQARLGRPLVSASLPSPITGLGRLQGPGWSVGGGGQSGKSPTGWLNRCLAGLLWPSAWGLWA